MINTIVLDIGNVLAHFRWRQYLEDCGYDEETIRRIADATVCHETWNEWDRGSQEEAALIEASIQREPGLEKEIVKFLNEFNLIVKEYDFAEEFVIKLKENGYRVYLLSNYGRTFFSVCSPSFRFLKHVDGGIISYEVQHTKPEPEIYQDLIDKYQFDPVEAVFLDDTAINLEGAKPFGFHTIQVKNHEQALADMRAMGIRI